ncbi:hypothetical protein HMPREF1549_01144 [Actinomyces johnsonii F0510]|uniref:Uncharacterized protein n=1 Tax=Actinomyces johnsonii F0510 TaxID=1227262 RepID=U1QF33_9ACTO|nr:hypothetical protein HMPREF1549_01144 [Actinomyces johnsonii F0510]
MIPAVVMSTGEENFILTKEAVPRDWRRDWDRGPRPGRWRKVPLLSEGGGA